MLITAVCLYIIGIATFLFVMLGYMWLTTWQYREEFSWFSLLGCSVPAMCASAIPVVAGEFGMIFHDGLKYIVLAIVGALCSVAVVIAAFISIKKYRIDGFRPNYTAFGAVCAYSIALAAFSAVFML